MIYSLNRPAPGHDPIVSRYKRGTSRISGGSMQYGTRIRCDCGRWIEEINVAPSLGGRVQAGIAYRRHLAAEGVAGA